MNGEFTLSGKKHKCSVINGIRSVDGISIDEFFETLSEEEIIQFARIGHRAVQTEINGTQTKKGELQAMANNLI